MSLNNNYLLMKSNKSNSNNDYFIKKWCEVHLRLRVLSETLGLKRPPVFLATMEVPIKYRDPTNTDALMNK